MRELLQCAGGVLLLIGIFVAPAWGYYFDDRREMSLSGLLYTRAVLATQDGIAGQKSTYYAGNLVSHRNFASLEWRHNLFRATREMPTLGPLFQFLNFDTFDYYLNLRTEYDGVYDYGPNKIRKLVGGTNLHTPYWDNPQTATPNDGAYFTPGGAPDYPARFVSLSNRRWLRKLREPRIRLFEWYFNIAKGPLLIRIGKQNLSWGETDAFRLLDQINPLDNTFGGFLTSLDERRIPLNMLRVQWQFGTIGPVQDLSLDSFYSVDNEVSPILPTPALYFWVPPGPGNATYMQGRTPCGGDFMARRGIPPLPEAGYAGSGPGPNHGGGCSVRANLPHSSLADGRGGVRLLGTIADFTWSVAHYYTYQDLVAARLTIISPTQQHLLWDLGLSASGSPNPWGPGDPVAARMISAAKEGNPLGNLTGQGGIASLAGVERNLRFGINYERIQVTGASLSFPVSALTSVFVGPDSPLHYLYTTVRSEVAFFRNVPTGQAFAHADSNTGIARYLGIGLYAPDGPLAAEAGRRAKAFRSRDWLLWNIGVDHNQWIRWLNPDYTFTFSGQFFWTHRNGQQRSRPDTMQPASVFNDRDQIAGLKREPQNPQSASFDRSGNAFWNFGAQDEIFTLGVNTTYLRGNLKPSVNFFYDWSGSWLIQPGVDWIFAEPFRLSLRYAWIDGRNNMGLGVLNRSDNVWFELQYVMY